jgi:NADH dehydrogenase
MADGGKHRVVIVGGGFGGLYAAKGLRRSPVEVTLLDRRNFHLFQPLLYQVATGGLSPANIASPLRSILKYHPHTQVLLGEAVDFELHAPAGGAVVLCDGRRLPFDTLVLAAGSTHHYFGKDAQWAPLAPGLKTIEDATEIRRKVLAAFEKAEWEPDPERRKKLLTFVVVGGGPTGVEMAGTIAELARITLRRDFRNFDPAAARVVCVEGQPRVLPQFAEKLSRKGGEMLRGLGVEVVLDAHVTELHPDHIVYKADAGGAGPTRIDTETVIWAAGVKASPLGKKLAEKVPGTEVDKGGRVTVAPDCTVPGRPDVFIIGDGATFKGADGKPLPGLAPVAMQQGTYVATVIDRRARGEAAPAAFAYWDRGTMATIGRGRAVADIHWMRFAGVLAWLAWLFIHIMYLAKFENRVLVMFQWFFNYVTRNRTARLMTGETGSARGLFGEKAHPPAAASPNGAPASSTKTWN